MYYLILPDTISNMAPYASGKQNYLIIDIHNVVFVL